MCGSVLLSDRSRKKAILLQNYLTPFPTITDGNEHCHVKVFSEAKLKLLNLAAMMGKNSAGLI